jgi:hypothetical protein
MLIFADQRVGVGNVFSSTPQNVAGYVFLKEPLYGF